MHEHYGVTIATSRVRRITQKHARAFHQQKEFKQSIAKNNNADIIIAETDGGMVPVVKIDPTATDKRKGKTLEWNEAKICLAHAQGSTDIAYGGTFSGGVDELGCELKQCATAVGLNAKRRLHVVGDGATWISNQIEEHFGTQGTYLIDFYHACDYLAAAAKACSAQPSAWLDQQKSALKTNQYKLVLAALLPHIEPHDIPDTDAPVRKTYRYLHNRRHQLDYQSAIAQELPIGSGEIESAHRYLVQQRLKRPGAWWSPDNVDAMLALRIGRFNHRWHDYWTSLNSAA